MIMGGALEMESRKKAKIILAGAALAVLATIELTLFLCFRLSRPFYLSTACVVSVALASAAAALLCSSHHGRAHRMSRRRSVLDGGGGGQEEGLDVEYSFFRKVAGLPRRFSLATLAAATDEFGCVVGRGSSGTVFRGVLDDGTAVAVKRMDGGPSARLAEREFRAEAGAIGGAQHAGLVRLLGFCVVPHGGPRFLVYEFMEHGSLDKWIFPSSPSPSSSHGGSNHRWLTWRQRRQVAVDVARALAYLHGDLRGGTKVVHLDVKPENILLDDAFRGVLSDFGLSTLMGKDQSRVVTTVRGTTGYLAPEWLLGAGVTDKSDVYSFGMVLMEMLGGRRNLQIIEEAGEVVVEGSSSSSRRRRWSYFPKIVAEKVREGRVMEVVDPRVREEAAAADEAGVRRVAHVALWCAQEKASARPDMARVVEMLEARGGAATEVEPPPPSEMILVDVLALDPDRAPRPFGLPPVPSSGWNTGVSSSAMSRSDSFALSYLSGR